ncbi:carboxypeptidase-like regulatory domain-containing protein [Thermococcus sp. CX2]|uniref:carboxypeptidase-like regulatory domain-containing protein n=1 Tax=Thermococcus sp. CX2 TaxID=163006 RepID=UPI001F0E15D9|nr:carboxypeptidase-like regulatory domain-containing protein [Thermococcus sp. CX2]
MKLKEKTVTIGGTSFTVRYYADFTETSVIIYSDYEYGLFVTDTETTTMLESLKNQISSVLMGQKGLAITHQGLYTDMEVQGNYVNIKFFDDGTNDHGYPTTGTVHTLDFIFFNSWSDGDDGTVQPWGKIEKDGIQLWYAAYKTPETSSHIYRESGLFIGAGDYAVTVDGNYPYSGICVMVVYTSDQPEGVQSYELSKPYLVTFHFKDALTGQSLSGVTVKEGNSVLGTFNDSNTLALIVGNHTLTFEKTGYWSVTKTIDVQDDMIVSVELYPSSAAFRFENFPTDITIPENTIYELTFTLSPIDTSATYNTYLSLSGLSDIIEVRKAGSLVSPENGKYYLGDISSPVQVSIKFKAGAVGTHGFTLTLTSNDAIMSKTYTTTKTVTYTVEPLPFSVQMPSEWQVGTNELRISESSGQSYLITAVLKDSQGNEVWSDSYAFSPYEAHTFQINVPAEGSYTLELTWNGQTAVYDITVNPAITLVTKTFTVSEGGEGVITLHFKNPSSSVQYYTIKVSGGFLPVEINQSISVAPLTEKDVSIAFAVPEDLTYDAYELQVQVLQGDAVVFSDKVAVSIGDSGGFTLFGGGSSGSTWLWIAGGLLVVGLGVWALRRR